MLTAFDQLDALPGSILGETGLAGWKQKRFWSDATVVAEGDGYAVMLDGRRIKTPAKAPLQVPTRVLAQMVADEWQAQGDEVDPTTMPATRMANAAIDKVQAQHDEVAGLIAAYGDTDLLCYRADSPQTLVDRQAEQWDPALAWARDALGVTLTPGAGVMHIPQSTADLARLAARVHALSAFELSALHDLVSLSGSLVLGFATTAGWRDAEELWQMSRLDELWQQEQWGEDSEASTVAGLKRQSFHHAARFFAKC